MYFISFKNVGGSKSKPLGCFNSCYQIQSIASLTPANKQVRLHFQLKQLGEKKLFWYELSCSFLRSILSLSGLTNTLALQDIQKFKMLPLRSNPVF